MIVRHIYLSNEIRVRGDASQWKREAGPDAFREEQGETIFGMGFLPQLSLQVTRVGVDEEFIDQYHDGRSSPVVQVPGWKNTIPDNHIAARILRNEESVIFSQGTDHIDSMLEVLWRLSPSAIVITLTESSVVF